MGRLQRRRYRRSLRYDPSQLKSHCSNKKAPRFRTLGAFLCKEVLFFYALKGHVLPRCGLCRHRIRINKLNLCCRSLTIALRHCRFHLRLHRRQLWRKFSGQLRLLGCLRQLSVFQFVCPRNLKTNRLHRSIRHPSIVGFVFNSRWNRLTISGQISLPFPNQTRSRTTSNQN